MGGRLVVAMAMATVFVLAGWMMVRVWLLNAC